MNILFTSAMTNFFRTFITRRFMAVFFDTGTVEKWKERAVYAAFFWGTLLAHVIFFYPPISIVTNLLLMYLIASVYEGTWKKRLLVVFLIYSVQMFCDIAVTYALNGDFVLGDSYAEVTAYVSVFLIWISEFIIERYLVKNRNRGFVPPCWKVLLAIPVISVGILTLLVVYDLKRHVLVTAVSTGILLINLLVFYLYDALTTAYVKREETMLLERQMDSYANQLEVLMQSEARVSGLKHDLKHHFIELLALAGETGKETELTDYLHSMQTELENPREYVASGNRELDSLFNYLIGRAKDRLAHVEYQVHVPRELQIRPYDFNVIIGNLLDNAIRAAAQSEKEWLSVSVSYEKELLFIRVENSFGGNVKEQNGVYLTTRTEKEGHGIGLQNVKRVVEKHNGSMEITSADGIFDVKIMLYTQNC